MDPGDCVRGERVGEGCAVGFGEVFEVSVGEGEDCYGAAGG